MRCVPIQLFQVLIFVAKLIMLPTVVLSQKPCLRLPSTAGWRVHHFTHRRCFVAHAAHSERMDLSGECRRRHTSRSFSR